MPNTEITRLSGLKSLATGHLALALLAGGPGPAWAVSWNTGSNSGNWIWVNPTNATVGIGTAGTTAPAEKLTLTGGNVLIDNNAFYKAKSSSGASTNLMGLDASNNLSIYGGKIFIPASGNIQMGSVTVGGSASLAGNISAFGSAQISNGATIGGPINLNGATTINNTSTFNNYALFKGKVGINFTSSISDFYVLGKSNFNGQVNVNGGLLVAESGLRSLSAFEAASSLVYGDENVGGNQTVTGVLNVNGTSANSAFTGNVNVNGGGVSNFSGTNEFWGLTETGDLNVWGNISVSGAKNFVQPHPTDETKKIVYVAAEAGEALTMARGIARTENGKATVRLPDHFALVTSEDVPLTVQITVEGAPALVYVVSKSRDAIEVKMKDSDFSEFQDVTFDYFVQGVRDGFEDHVAIQDVVPSREGEKLSPKHLRYNERVQKLARAMQRRAR